MIDNGYEKLTLVDDERPPPVHETDMERSKWPTHLSRVKIWKSTVSSSDTPE